MEGALGEARQLNCVCLRDDNESLYHVMSAHVSINAVYIIIIMFQHSLLTFRQL